jgi:hypothetical protein
MRMVTTQMRPLLTAPAQAGAVTPQGANAALDSVDPAFWQAAMPLLSVRNRGRL